MEASPTIMMLREHTEEMRKEKTIQILSKDRNTKQAVETQSNRVIPISNRGKVSK